MGHAPAPPGGAHLLLVEDDPALRELVVQVLTEEGYRAHGAPSGAAALALLARPDAPPVDAVLLDLRLPDMDGPAFAAEYRRRPGPPAPLLVFTGAPPAEAAAAAAQLGAAGVVPKPFDLDELLAAVGRCLPTPVPPPDAAAVVSPSALGEPTAAPAALMAWEPDARRRQLTRLRAEVERVRTALRRVQTEVLALAAAEATRTLTAAEARRVPALRRESEALRLELGQFGAEFELLRAAARPPQARRRRGPA
jgi:two-component system response regulator MprA